MEPLNIVMTGGHSGIGLELATTLSEEGHHLTLLVRSEARLADVRSRGLSNVDWVEVDLADQRDITRAGGELTQRLPRIDRLFNVAGVLLPDLQRSPQGNEMHYEVNTLAPILLSAALKTSLDVSPVARIVNVVTDAMSKQKTIDFTTLHHPTKIKKLTGSYMQSKLALTLATAYLARQPAWTPVDLVSVTPGPTKTPMTDGAGMPRLLVPIRNLVFAEPTKGARLVHRASFRDDVRSGDYLWKDKVAPLRIQLDDAGFDQVVAGLTEPSRELVAQVARANP